MKRKAYYFLQRHLCSTIKDTGQRNLKFTFVTGKITLLVRAEKKSEVRIVPRVKDKLAFWLNIYM